MTWLAWRLQRPLVLAAVSALGAAVAFLAVTGAIEDHAYGVYAALRCAQPGSSSSCLAASFRYNSTTSFSTASAVLCVCLPGILGLVLGVPAVALELREQTIRFAWAQSVTRGRWLAGKAAIGGLLVVAAFACLVPFFAWWSGAVQRGEGILPRNFDLQGVVPLGYACFAYSLGLALGAVVRRVGWAFAIGVPIFAAVRLGIDHFVRPLLATAVATATTDANWLPAHAWVLNEGFLPVGALSPPAGTSWSTNDALAGACSPGGSRQCLIADHLRWVVQYQPASHFWSIQLEEFGIYLGLAVMLLAVAAWKVRAWEA